MTNLYYRAYRRKNRLRLRKYNREYEKIHPRNRSEYFKLWREKHPDYGGYDKKYAKIYYSTHRDSFRKRAAQYRKTHLEKVRLQEKVRFHCNRCNKIGGKITVADVQAVYENNIKKLGTLTCYLCIKPIAFGEDCLEHKIPIFRGGTNKKSNLAIAHKVCDSKKNTKTYKEFLKTR